MKMPGPAIKHWPRTIITKATMVSEAYRHQIDQPCFITAMPSQTYENVWCWSHLGHTHYILRLTDPDMGCSGLSERKKNKI